MARALRDNPDEQHALIWRTDQRNQKLAIFIHGFRGGYLSTWARVPDLLYQAADVSSDTSDWDFFFMGYSTENVETYLDIANLVGSQWDHAVCGNEPFPHAYGKFALFGHSLGTLGIRQFLCAAKQRPPNIAQQLCGVTLFGTPLNGSPLALFALTYSIRHALKPNNPQLRMLHGWTEDAYAASTVWPHVRIVLGQDDKVVGATQSQLIRFPGDAKTVTTTLDHAAIVKPTQWQGSFIAGEIQGALRCTSQTPNR